MPKITLADLTAEPTTLELPWGAYNVRPLARSVKQKFHAAQSKLDAYDDEDDDKSMSLLASTIETLLEPVGDAPVVAKAITDAWKKDELNLGQIRALYEKVQESALARPT